MDDQRPAGPSLASLFSSLRGTLGALRTPRYPGSAEGFDGDRLDRRDPELIAQLLPTFRFLNHRYLQLQVSGLQHLAPGPALYVANHNGGIMGPDLGCTLATLWDRLGTEAPLYPLAHDFAMRQFAPLGRVLQRLGAVRACPANARRVLACGGQALVYPGGDLDAYRHTRRRNEVVLGERTGFVRIAQETGVPIIPIVVHGAHRSAYIFSEGEGIARRLRLPRWGRVSRFPMALALPWGLALGPWLPYLPLPFPIRLRVLPPWRVPPEYDPVVAREKIRAGMQEALDELARAGADD
jgi:1-acyl-sn-glycerol-3-phosphate acyltransferase